ncbi:MAG: ssDNA-binding protein [Nitrospiraceae bacterium]
MAEVKRYVTPVFRASFPEVFEPKSYDGGKPKFSVAAVWTPAKFSDRDKKLWKIMKAALDEVSVDRFKKKVKDLPANFKTVPRDGSEKADMEGYGEGTKFANLTTMMRPGVVDLSKTKIGPEEGNADEIYPGCYMRATVTVYSYDNKGKGVAFGLMNLQKVKDGEHLDSRTDAAEDFDEEVDAAWLDEDEDDSDIGDEFD